MLILFYLFCKVNLVHNAKIFGIFTTPSVSHQSVFQPIWKELSLRGHQVTVVTPNPLNDPSLINLTEIDVSYSYDLLNVKEIVQRNLLPDELFNLAIYRPNLVLFKPLMSHPSIQQLLQDKHVHFDLVLTEMLWAPAYAFSFRFSCPFIGILSLSETYPALQSIGNPVHPILNPNSFLGFDKQLKFSERIKSVYSQLRMSLRYAFEFMPDMDKIARNYFGSEMPYLGDIEKNVSLLITTGNFMISQPVPTVPALINVGNIHLKLDTQLPEDLLRELDKETKGVIYFSLGSNIKSTMMSEKLIGTIISALSDIPYKILWKWDISNISMKLNNVVIRKWFPQEAVLAHPNVKVFVTHGGLQSIEEAIYYGKPMVVLPFFADQLKNAKIIQNHEIGVELDITNLSKAELKTAILKVFNDQKFTNRVKQMSNLLQDQPMPGLNKSIWCIEYVIRHKGARHLRSPLLDIPFYQYFLLDIFALIGGLILLMLIFIYIIFCYLKSLANNVRSDNKHKTSYLLIIIKFY